MKRKRYSVEQIVAILKQAEVGVPVVELIRQAGISFDVLRICQHNVEVGLKHVPDRFPIDTRRFHWNVLNA